MHRPPNRPPDLEDFYASKRGRVLEWAVVIFFSLNVGIVAGCWLVDRLG